MLIAVKNNRDFDKTIKAAIIIAEKNKTNFLTLLSQPAFHMDLFDYMLKEPSIDRLKVGIDTMFIVGDYRIEIKKIHAAV